MLVCMYTCIPWKRFLKEIKEWRREVRVSGKSKTRSEKGGCGAMTFIIIGGGEGEVTGGQIAERCQTESKKVTKTEQEKGKQLNSRREFSGKRGKGDGS